MGWKGKLLIVVSAVIALLLILAGLIFSPLGDIPSSTLTPADAVLQSRLFTRISQEVIKGKPRESELVLSPADIDSLVRLSDNGFALNNWFSSGNSLPPRYYQLKLVNSNFDFTVPVNTNWRILFGGVIRLIIAVEIDKEADDIDISFSKFKIGHIPLPLWLARRIALKQLEKNRHHPNFIAFNRVVKSLFCDEQGNLHIVYRPLELRTTFLGF